MMMNASKSRLVFGLMMMFAMSAAGSARGEQPSAAASAPAAGVDSKADDVLRKMGATLGAAKSFSVSAHAIVDLVQPDGQKIQYARNQKMVLRRPDKLAADVVGDTEELQVRYDGKQVALYNPQTRNWGSTEAPATIEQTLDMLAQKYGIVMPLADLAFSDPYKTLIENVRRGEYVGVGYVFDKKCHHLAFRQAAIDWQIFVQEGDKPLPLKVIITFKDQPAHPQYTAFLSDWNLSANANDDAFVLQPPAGAKKVDFAPPATQPAAGGGAR